MQSSETTMMSRIIQNMNINELFIQKKNKDIHNTEMI